MTMRFRGLTQEQFAARVRAATTRVAKQTETLRTVATDIVETNLTVGGAHSPGTPVDEGVALAGWDRQRVGPVDLITNDVPYMPALKDGHSQQAKDGFVRPTARAWPQIVQEARAIVAQGGERGGVYAGGR